MSNITIRDVVVNAASTVQKEKTIVLKNGLVNIIKSGPLPEYSIFNLSFANVSIAGHSMADIVHDPDWFRIGDGVTDLTVDGQPVVTG